MLEALDDGRLTIGEHTLLEPRCWITIADDARVSIGPAASSTCTMVAAQHEVTIGDHTMFANHCFVSDPAHPYDDPHVPVTWQGFTKGPVRIGSNCWFGVGCVVTSGVTIGDRSVVGANSVVTRDLPPGVIAAGAPPRSSARSISGLQRTSRRSRPSGRLGAPAVPTPAHSRPR